jgi:recombination DNA repair RAD52 pathway protein
MTRLSAEQHDYLLNNLRSTRVAQRNAGGKTLSYLEAWDVKAHLTRVFGFGNWDLETLDYQFIGNRPYVSKDEKAMVEVMYSARVQLTVRVFDEQTQEMATLCRYSECASGSSAAPDYLVAESHDNALKTAVSDATKRCAINLGTQFGLSLYDNGNRNDIVKFTLVRPEGATKGIPPSIADVSPEGAEALATTLGATPVSEEPTEAERDEAKADADQAGAPA